jgi:hypothetical protein
VTCSISSLSNLWQSNDLGSLRLIKRLQQSPASTIRTYSRTVEHYSQHFHRPPDQLLLEHIREYQAAMFRTWNLAPNTVSQRLAALRFLYIQVLKRGWSAAETPYPNALTLEADQAPTQTARTAPVIS